MRWSCLIALFGLSVTPVASFSQRTPNRQGSASEHSETPLDAGYFADGIVRFQLIHGRLCLDPPQHRKGSQKRRNEYLHESITVTAESWTKMFSGWKSPWVMASAADPAAIRRASLPPSQRSPRALSGRRA